MSESRPVELYIHIPFCAKKCSYCDFLSAPSDDVTMRSYVDKLIEEIRAQSTGYNDYHVSSIFIGGGTPSILPANSITSIMSAVYESWTVDGNAEISIEANPGTVNEDKLGMYYANGVNRISFGLQSSNEDELKKLGRIHTYEDFLKSFSAARTAGFSNINVDLMSGIPGQSLASWKETLSRVTMLKPEHISAYSLIIEEDTPFWNMYGNKEGRKLLPSEEEDREMYHITKEILANAGYERYEISNYAKKGYECRHNLGYWTGTEYLGLGLGSSSFVKNYRFHNENDLKTYLDTDMTDLTAIYQDMEQLSKNDLMEEFMFLGLRCTKGVSGPEFYNRFGANMFNEFEYAIWKNVKMGLLEIDGSTLRYTDKGLDLANAVEIDFVGHKNSIETSDKL